MPAVTVLRGFQVSVSTLDAFLLANGVSETDGIPPNYPDHPDNDHISKLLFSKMGETGDKNNYRVIIPQRTSKSDADTAYITYCWFMVFAQRELRDGDLPTEAPQAFEGLRKEVLSFANTPNDQADGRMGLYIVFTEENNYMPEEIRERNLIVRLAMLFSYCTVSLQYLVVGTNLALRGTSNATSVMNRGLMNPMRGRDGKHTVYKLMV